MVQPVHLNPHPGRSHARVIVLLLVLTISVSLVAWLLVGAGSTVLAAPNGNLSLTIEAEPMTAAIGDVVTYTIRLQNQGGAIPVQATMTNSIPTGLRVGGLDRFRIQTQGTISPARVKCHDDTF